MEYVSKVPPYDSRRDLTPVSLVSSTAFALYVSGDSPIQNLAQYIADTNPAFKGMTARQVFDKRIGDIIPLKREQTPEDIGWAATFLASRLAASDRTLEQYETLRAQALRDLGNLLTEEERRRV